MSDIKRLLAESYDRDASRRSSKSLPTWKIEERQAYADRLRRQNKTSLLELGAGTGIDGRYFKENGWEPVCIDLSEESVRLCRERGLDAQVADFYRLPFGDNRFQAIYALNCLLHVPKNEIDQVLKEIKRVTEPDGLLYIGLYGGRDSEGVWEEDWCEPKRFFSFYSDHSIQEIVTRFFQIVDFHTIAQGGDQPHFQALTLRKTLS